LFHFIFISRLSEALILISGWKTQDSAEVRIARPDPMKKEKNIFFPVAHTSGSNEGLSWFSPTFANTGFGIRIHLTMKWPTAKTKQIPAPSASLLAQQSQK